MDAAWKVYVGDRRFDDNQISNLFLKLKYETVGRFTFDFRPIDGDESYMVANNTLRIFWGDLHRLDGVIQRADWDSNLQCYHVYGADIRGFLLDRVNTEPSTVSSYTSDVQTQVMYEGCDFPANVWTGAGDKIGTYTFHYKLGIQNTIRITGATQNIWHNVIERGTVYDHVNGCLYDATKNWEVNKYAGATLRFVSGACKNNVYNVNGNTANRVCIRLPGESATMYGDGYDPTIVYEGETLGQIIRDPGIEEGSGGSTYPGDLDAWVFLSSTSAPDDFAATETDDSYAGAIAYSVYIPSPNAGSGGAAGPYRRWETPGGSAYGGWVVLKFFARVDGTWEPGDSIGTTVFLTCNEKKTGIPGVLKSWQLNTYGASNDWTEYTLAKYVSPSNNTYGRDSVWDLKMVVFTTPGNITSDTITVYFDDVRLYAQYHDPVEFGGGAAGTVPGCSRIGDIYEIVTASMERIEPASVAPATLEKDNHIIKYNQTDELPDHQTVVTVTGTGDTPPSNTISFSVIAVGAAITQSVIDAALAQVPRDIWSFHPGPVAEEGVNWQKGSVYFGDPAVGDLPTPLQDFTICISDPDDFEDLGDSYGSTHAGTHKCGVWNIPGIVDGTVLHELLHTTSAIFLHTEAEQLSDAGYMKWLKTAHPTYGPADVAANYGTLCNEYALYTYRNG